MRENKSTILDWLCLNEEFLKSKRTGSIVGVFLIILALLYIPIIIFQLNQFVMAISGIDIFKDAAEKHAAIRNSGLALAALISIPFFIWRSFVAQKQVDVSEQGQITDRINTAVEGLGSEKIVRKLVEIPRYKKDGDEWKLDDKGNPVPALRPDGMPIVDRNSYEHTSPNLEVRIGAIYALERIAHDSRRDHIQIMEILCAYVRENSPVTSMEPTDPPFDRSVPRTDIQAAITVIGRRSKEQIKHEWEDQFRLDLRSTNLSGVDFRGGDFSAALFYTCRLEAALFSQSKLIGTRFNYALLNFTHFHGAELRGTNFDYAIVNRPLEWSGGTRSSINLGDIYGISVAGADISSITSFGQPQKMNLIFGTRDTQLHKRFKFSSNKLEDQIEEIRQLKEDSKHEQASEIQTILNKKGFADWSPYDSNDGVTFEIYEAFRDKLGLSGWPYQ